MLGAVARAARRVRSPSRISRYSREDVPVEAVGQRDRLVREAVDLVEAQRAVGPTRPTITRPLDAPRSIAATEPEAELAAEVTAPTAGPATRRSRRS